MKRILLIGRWAPFHLGHKAIVDSFLKAGKRICIAIRESEEKYSVLTRTHMIRSVYQKEIKNEMLKIITIPDIEGVAVGRDVGYFYVDLPEDIKKISGTKIREGSSHDVPDEVKKIMDVWDSHQKAMENGEVYGGDDIFSKQTTNPLAYDQNSHGGDFNGENKRSK